MGHTVEINEAFMKQLLTKGTVTKDVKDYGNEPFFIKKADAAKKRLDKVKIPNVLTGKK